MSVSSSSNEQSFHRQGEFSTSEICRSIKSAHFHSLSKSITLQPGAPASTRVLTCFCSCCFSVISWSRLCLSHSNCRCLSSSLRAASLCSMALRLTSSLSSSSCLCCSNCRSNCCCFFRSCSCLLTRTAIILSHRHLNELLQNWDRALSSASMMMTQLQPVCTSTWFSHASLAQPSQQPVWPPPPAFAALAAWPASSPTLPVLWQSWPCVCLQRSLQSGSTNMVILLLSVLGTLQQKTRWRLRWTQVIFLLLLSLTLTMTTDSCNISTKELHSFSKIAKYYAPTREQDGTSHSVHVNWSFVPSS